MRIGWILLCLYRSISGANNRGKEHMLASGYPELMMMTITSHKTILWCHTVYANSNKNINVQLVPDGDIFQFMREYRWIFSLIQTLTGKCLSMNDVHFISHKIWFKHNSCSQCMNRLYYGFIQTQVTRIGLLKWTFLIHCFVHFVRDSRLDPQIS